ncbi:MAG: phosphoglucomutase/phosphomannomutase family protein [Candidatus Omnitrophica bacterium]|nr:phosphoglucomutase/phosphomannomutase family protein [Candidatus Omnitrophota bacterium]
MNSIKFGTDGWRAVIADDFTFGNLKVLSQAVADFLKKSSKGEKIKVAVGFDSRFLSKEFAQAVSSVLCGNNIKVILSQDSVPTPIVSFYTKYKNCDLGIMITASHNPYRFNGFKIKTPQGGSAGVDITRGVEKLLFTTKVKLMPKDESVKKGLLTISDLSPDYIKFIKNYVNLSLIKKLKLKVLVDLMYGSGNSYIERVLSPSKIKFSYLHKEFNPSFGGIHPEPTEENIKGLIKEMKKGKFDLGVVLDGDGDRIACVLKGGRYVNAQLLLPLLAVHLARNRRLSGAIVKTVVGSNIIDLVSLSLNRICFETPVGFKYISRLFAEEDILIGGEEAGGIGVKNYIPERDATMATVLFLEMLAFLKKTPLELIREFEKRFGRWHYSRTSIPVSRVSKDSLNRLKIPKYLLGKKVIRVNKLDGIKVIADSAWLMFRASGTEPIVRVYAEAKSKIAAQKLVVQGKRLLHNL